MRLNKTGLDETKSPMSHMDQHLPNSSASAMSAIASTPENQQAKDSLHLGASNGQRRIGSMLDHDTKLSLVISPGA